MKVARKTLSKRPARAPAETWITGATILTQNAERRVTRGNVRVIDGVIDSITTRSPPSRGAKIRDARGLTLLPGFVQAHIHLCQTLFRNLADDLELMDWLQKKIWVFEGAHTRETLHASALLGIYELLSGGTTTILDMGTVRYTDAIFRAVKETGIRASVGKCLMDDPRGSPPGLRDESTAAALAETDALFKKWHGAENDRIRMSYAPRFVLSCTEKLLREVAVRARAQGTLVHTHANENRRELELIRKQVGCENIEYLERVGLTADNLVLAHCVWLTDRERSILKRSGTSVAHCPSSNLKLASGIADIPGLRADGIRVALGADGAPCNNQLSALTEMRLAALIHKPKSGPKALPAAEILDLATREGAKALGWFDQIGSLEPGKKADIIGLDLNQPENIQIGSGKTTLDSLASRIVYSSTSQHVKWTLIDGIPRWQDGALPGLPTASLLRKVRLAQARIARTIALKTRA